MGGVGIKRELKKAMGKSTAHITKLQIGCGYDNFEGYINVDIDPNSKADLICDANRLPFDSNYFTEIYAHHSLEHFKDLKTIVEELARVSKNGCIWDIVVPYYTWGMNIINPYHHIYFNEDTFRFWDDIYKREQPKWFKLETLNVSFDFNKELYGEDADFERLLKTNINVCREISFKIKVHK